MNNFPRFGHPLAGRPFRSRPDLAEGESITGTVVRPLMRSAVYGNHLFLHTGDEVVAFHASASKGHTHLERQLQRQNVTAGDHVSITFTGWGEKPLPDGSCKVQFRAYRVEVHERGLAV